MVNSDKPADGFFYKYKQMPISSNNLFKQAKSPEQLREDKAV